MSEVVQSFEFNAEIMSSFQSTIPEVVDTFLRKYNGTSTIFNHVLSYISIVVSSTSCLPV